MQYDHKKIEKKWQEEWARTQIYSTPDKAPGKDNFYLLVEFPYPSGNLHVGHWYSFAVPDILARYTRMSGKNVVYPIGFDAFGLPAENAAIKNKLNPRDWTEQNIAYMSNQIRSMGTMFDWSREVRTIDPAYYKWTQWQFLKFLEKGLAYQKETAVNWCPSCKTVLANEQVIDGKCERCGSEVVQKMMLQWNLKITDYADRLHDDLEALDWPKEIKDSQRNWIGRSEGAEIDFPIDVGENKKYVILHGFTSGADRPRFVWLKNELEKMGHEVVVPQLPDTDNPNEADQVKAALECTTYDENTVLLGFSLGAVVALKVLEKLDQPIAGLVTAGGFCDTAFKDKKRPFETTFAWDFDAGKIRKNAPSITILHDPRDYAVSEEQRARLETLLGVEAVIANTNEPHFGGDAEPDVLMHLRPTVRVFTTRADTLFGATYLVLAPEHALMSTLLPQVSNAEAVQKYISQANKKTELERQAGEKEKTGVKLEGVSAINPATGEKVPLYVADYVLATYGTGAIMAVPAHDERDAAFAQKFNIPVKQVVAPIVRATPPRLDAVHEGEPFEDRNAVMCVVKHWSKDEYLCIQWKDFDVRTFISGGIEAGETPEDAGKREITEESGYTDALFKRQLGGTSVVEFYHRKKETNVRATFRYLYFELQSGAQVEMSAEEQAKHDVVWKKPEELSAFLTIMEKDRLVRAIRGEEDLFTGDGILVNSGEYSGVMSDEARKLMTEKFGRAKKTYRLRDWIVSRQRYWGVPIPVVHCAKCGIVAVPDEQLPVLLPEVDDYLPEGTGKSPLAKAKDWVNTSCPKCGGAAERETDTFDTFIDSSWYFVRYTDPNNAVEFAARDKQDAWMPIDLYSGGAEHTTLHLLYSRFWHKAMYDLGLVADSEPYTRRMNRGIILGPDGQKMSKSKGNVVDPDAVVEKLGADTVRMYLAFIGPYEVGAYPWNPDGVVGVRRFIERVARAEEYVIEEDVAALIVPLHKALKKVGEDCAALKFNTAISQLMILLNAIEKEKQVGRTQWATLIKMLAPFAPHLAEELWHHAGNIESIHLQSWPVYEEQYLVEENVTIAIQINGKTRGEVTVPSDADKAATEAAAREAVASRLHGAEFIRTVVVPGRLVNFVIKQ